MRRIFQISTLCFAAGVVNACKPTETITAPAVQTAGVSHASRTTPFMSAYIPEVHLTNARHPRASHPHRHDRPAC